jgi:hypothetical protein
MTQDEDALDEDLVGRPYSNRIATESPGSLDNEPGERSYEFGIRLLCWLLKALWAPSRGAFHEIGYWVQESDIAPWVCRSKSGNTSI